MKQVLVIDYLTDAYANTGQLSKNLLTPKLIVRDSKTFLRLNLGHTTNF